MADIFPEERELKVLVTEGDDVRWWLICQDGSLVPEEDQKAIRPADATPCDGDWYMPWYNTKAHMHDQDHDYPWSIHARGTRDSVELLHTLMIVLRRQYTPELRDLSINVYSRNAGWSGEPAYLSCRDCGVLAGEVHVDGCEVLLAELKYSRNLVLGMMAAAKKTVAPTTTQE